MKHQMLSRPRFQVLVRTATPPQVAGIDWHVKGQKSFSQEFDVTQDDMSTKESCPFDIGALPPDAECLLVLTEEGGGYTSRGDALVVCGMHGEPLFPFYSPRGKANTVHAKFTVRTAIIVQVYRLHDTRDIAMFKVGVDGMARFSIEEIWWVNTTTLEIYSCIKNKVLDFKAAILAANDKSTCYHCRHAHYIKQRESGVLTS